MFGGLCGLRGRGERTMARPCERLAPEMRGLVIISVPRSDSDGKTVCAAMWQHPQQQQQQQHQQQHEPQEAQPQFQQLAPTLAYVDPARDLRRKRRFRRFFFFSVALVAAIMLGFKAPEYLTSDQEGEDDERRVHVYTLYPKFTSVPIKMTQMRRTLLERDLKRLGKASAGSSNNNSTALFPVRGNIYPDGYNIILPWFYTSRLSSGMSGGTLD